MAKLDFTEVISCTLIDAHASDLAVVNAARISFDTQHPELTAGDEKLIDWLLRSGHGSPFEHGYFKFLVEAPIFAVREHHRHRAGHSYNEMSGRYTELEPKFHFPKAARVQIGKPGAYAYVEQPCEAPLSQYLRSELASSYAECWMRYNRMLTNGIAKEQARAVLPLGIYTKMIWSCNPRSLMHFIGLRAAADAQQEIREVAEAAEAALKEKMPVTHAAFACYGGKAP